MARYFATSVAVLVSACSGPPLLPLPGRLPTQSLSVGRWSGTTSQGMPIVFSVSADQTVTSIEVGYDFNGCSGSLTYGDISVPTAPNVTCMDGPCPAAVSAYRAFGYSAGPVHGPRMQINGLFLPGERAQGQVGFFDYPNCGTATAVQWSATRR
jgi:hypothetical protein